MKTAPSPNGGNGVRDSNGRFKIGNPGGPGNPQAKKVGQLRSVIVEAVTADDMRAIVAALVKRARDGDLAAIREILNRLVGSPADAADRTERADERREIAKQQFDLAEQRLFLQEEALNY